MVHVAGLRCIPRAGSAGCGVVRGSWPELDIGHRGVEELELFLGGQVPGGRDRGRDGVAAEGALGLDTRREGNPVVAAVGGEVAPAQQTDGAQVTVGSEVEGGVDVFPVDGDA